MLEFLTEHTQTQFHLLPVEAQKSITESAAKLLESGFICMIMHVSRDDGHSEISIRIAKKFDVNTTGTLF